MKENKESKRGFLYYAFTVLLAGAIEKILLLIPKKIMLSVAMRLHKRFEDDKTYRLSLNKNVDVFREYVKRGLQNLNKSYIAAYFRSSLFCNGIIWPYLREKNEKKHNVHVPQMIAFSVTNKCNLRCFGCYSSEHSKDSLPFSIIESKIIRAGNSIGIGLFTVLGGEPFLYPHILDLTKNKSSFFAIYTNGYFLDTEKIDKLSKMGNVGVFFGIGGFEKSTDKMRGEGAFRVAREKMEMLRQRGAPFGLSIMVTKENWQEVSSLSFIDEVIGWGAFNLSYFLYGPIGREPKIDLVLSCKEKIIFNNRIENITKTKPINILNEMNQRCDAGASNKGMIHVTAKGDIEPCFAIHYSTENIFRSTLLEALKSKFFLEIQKTNSELSCGCIVHESTQKVVSCVRESRASVTQPQAETQYKNFIKEQKSREQNFSTVEMNSSRTFSDMLAENTSSNRSIVSTK